MGLFLKEHCIVSAWSKVTKLKYPLFLEGDYAKGQCFICNAEYKIGAKKYFMISLKKGIFYCFSCLNGGDVYGLIMSWMPMNLMQAKAWCNNFGVDRLIQKGDTLICEKEGCPVEIEHERKEKDNQHALEQYMTYKLEEETDHVIFWHKNHQCIILRNQLFGTLCGYVGIKWAMSNLSIQEIKKILKEVSVHGGITFFDVLDDQRVKDHIRGYMWFAGFDCAHDGDFVPLMHTRSTQNSNNATYKDIPYVMNECRKLVDEIIAIEKDNEEG